MASIAFSPAPARSSANALALRAGVGRGQERIRHRWVVLLAGGYLAAVFFSRWDWPAIIVAAVSIILILVRVAVLGRIDRIGWAVVIYLAALTAYGLMVGSAPPLSDLKAFLSFEGRVYVAYLPLLALATATVSPGDLSGVRRLIRWSVVFGGALILR
jgi:hypothetical protein